MIPDVSGHMTNNTYSFSGHQPWIAESDKRHAIIDIISVSEGTRWPIYW